MLDVSFSRENNNLLFFYEIEVCFELATWRKAKYNSWSQANNHPDFSLLIFKVVEYGNT